MSMRCRIFELQQFRATLAVFNGDAISKYCDRRILAIEAEIEKLLKVK